LSEKEKGSRCATAAGSNRGVYVVLKYLLPFCNILNTYTPILLNTLLLF